MMKLHKDKASWQAHPIASKEWIQQIKREIKLKQKIKEEEYLKQGFSKHAAELWAKTNDDIARVLMELGPPRILRGKKLDDRQVILDIIKAQDTKIMRFLKEAEDLSLSPREPRYSDHVR